MKLVRLEGTLGMGKRGSMAFGLLVKLELREVGMGGFQSGPCGLVTPEEGREIHGVDLEGAYLAVGEVQRFVVGLRGRRIAVVPDPRDAVGLPRCVERELFDDVMPAAGDEDPGALTEIGAV